MVVKNKNTGAIWDVTDEITVAYVQKHPEIFEEVKEVKEKKTAKK